MSERGLLYVVVVAVSWLVFFRLKQPKSRQLLLLLVSYLLYASWGLLFAIFLFLSSLFNFVAGRWLRRQPGAFRLWLGVLANLAFLAMFKYSSVMSIVFRHLHSSSVLAPGSSANVFLPIGISFWTFQALSYLFDLYRGEDLQPSLLEFLLYMSFWPTVLSGPICRLSDLLPQFRSLKNATLQDTARGMDRICIGVFMLGLSQILANGIHMNEGLDYAFQISPGHLSGADVWCLSIGYGFELFFNFAGYSHLVIGAARLFGFALAENFDRPYLSTTPSEFWTRWHMSLSFWIRDYLFLPLVMLNRSKLWRNCSLVISMLIFGLWHKGSVLLGLWGVYQGVLLVLHRQWQELKRSLRWDFTGPFPDLISWFVTTTAVCLGWVLFRAGGLNQAVAMFRAVGDLSSYSRITLPHTLYVLVFVFAVGYLGLILLQTLVGDRLQSVRTVPELRFAMYSISIYMGIFHTAQSQGFAYFKF